MLVTQEQQETGFSMPKPVEEQIGILRNLSLVGTCEGINGKSIPRGADGFFVIPRWELVASKYHTAVRHVLALIKKTRDGKFYNYREDEIGPLTIRCSKKTDNAFRALAEQQAGCDLLVVACQFGSHYRDYAVDRVLSNLRPNEFGLDAFSVGIMLLTHPERLMSPINLWIDCPGGEFVVDEEVSEEKPTNDRDFNHAPLYRYCEEDKIIAFGAGHIEHRSEKSGSATGFLVS